MLEYQEEIKTANIENKDFYVNMINDGIDIIKRDMELFKNNKNE